MQPTPDSIEGQLLACCVADLMARVMGGRAPWQQDFLAPSTLERGERIVLHRFFWADKVRNGYSSGSRSHR
jgi:hypothetical protein